MKIGLCYDTREAHGYSNVNIMKIMENPLSLVWQRPLAAMVNH